MVAPMTPNSEMLYSYLNLDAFNTPGDLYIAPDGKEEDIFARAFGAHGSGEIKSKSDSMQNSFVLQHNKLRSQYISATPPSSIGAASDSPVTDFPNITNTQDPKAPSQISGYLAHVLSTRKPDNVFSYENQYDPGYTLCPDSTNAITENENTSEPGKFGESYRDPFAAIPELPSEVQLDFPNQNEGLQIPHSESSINAPEAVAAPAPIKVKKTRKRRNNRTAEEEAARHEAFLERNRKAAGKCRSKKKDRVQQLIWDMEASRSMNNQLKAEHWALLDEVVKLRAWALEHTKLAAEGSCTAMERGAAQSECKNDIMMDHDETATKDQTEQKFQRRISILGTEAIKAESRSEDMNLDTNEEQEVDEFLVDVDMDCHDDATQNAENETSSAQDYEEKPGHPQMDQTADSPQNRDRVPSLDSSSGTIEDSDGLAEDDEVKELGIAMKA